MPSLFLPYSFFLFDMAFLHVALPNKNIYTRTLLHAIGRAHTDGEMRANLRLIVAVLLAQWSDTHAHLLHGQLGDLFDVVTSEDLYLKGVVKTVAGERDERLWFCSYIGFEKITSQWAKETHPDCHGVVCMRLFNQDARHNEIDSHSIQIYF